MRYKISFESALLSTLNASVVLARGNYDSET